MFEEVESSGELLHLLSCPIVYNTFEQALQLIYAVW